LADIVPSAGISDGIGSDWERGTNSGPSKHPSFEAPQGGLADIVPSAGISDGINNNKGNKSSIKSPEVCLWW